MLHIRRFLLGDASVETLCGLPLGPGVSNVGHSSAVDEPIPTATSADARCPACWAAWRREYPDWAKGAGRS